MKVCAHAAAKDACGLYRITLPIRALQKQNYWEDFNRQYETVLTDTLTGQTLIDVNNPPDADVVILQRVLKRPTFELMKILQERYGIAVVVEIDDSFHDLPKKHTAYSQVNPLLNGEHNRDWLMRACERADLVTCTTPELARRYAPHGRVVVLPNFVPKSYLNLKRSAHAGTWVGWAGATHTHVGDLESTGGGVGRAIEETDAILHIIGNGDGVKKGLATDAKMTTSGWVPLGRYPQAVAQLDVGIAPLVLNAFNQGKSRLKPMEFAAVGVPCVMSPTPDYLDLAANFGIGVIAENAVDWHHEVKRLIEDKAYRNELATKGREVVAEHLTIEKNAWRWEEAWAQALTNSKQRHAA